MLEVLFLFCCAYTKGRKSKDKKGKGIKIMKKVICVIYAFFTLLAFSTANEIITDEAALAIADTNDFFTIHIVKFGLNYEKAYGVNSAILFLLVAYFYYHIKKEKNSSDQRLEIVTGIGGLIFGFFMVFGNSFLHLDNWDLVYGNPFQLFISTINYIGYFLLFKYILTFFMIRVKNKLDKRHKNKKNQWDKGKAKNGRSILFYMIGFLICWLPYIIIFYPGTMNMDSLFEIEQYLGKINWTTHHPILPTIIFGTFMKIGSFYLSNDNLGLFLNNIFQIILGAFLLSYSIHYINQITQSKKIKYGLFSFFAFFPIWPIHFYTEVKDVYFSMALLLYLIFSMKFVMQKGKLEIKQWIVYVLSMIFVYLFRNNGVFILLLSFPFLAMAVRRWERIKIIAGTFLAIAFSFIFTQVYMQTHNITKGSIKEALAVPLQQTARYVSEYQLTKEEQYTISKLVAIKDMRENYNPETIDYVKARYKQETATNEDLKDYFWMWGKMFLKHPDVYVQATMNATYGYFYPDRKENKDGLAQFTIDAPDSINISHFNVYFLPDREFHRNRMELGIYALRNMPMIGLLFSCGFYTWILMVVTLMLWYVRRKREMVILVPLFVIVLVCMASPVNAFVRYMQPIMLTLPFVIGWMFKSKNVDRVKF